MSNSTPKDVQDLIAEFVTSKNQLLHEEIISSIKQESFSGKYTEESVQAEPTPQTAKITTGIPDRKTEALKRKIDILTEKNLELQRELTMLQMQAPQITTTSKQIGADELRMEFLNFTTAHIQQFNTRIKKTEELIESQIQRNQQAGKSRTSRDLPIWLYWTNIAVLGMIVVYFLFNMFSTDKREMISDKAAEIEQTAPAAIVPNQQTAEQTESNTRAVNTNTEASSTPFKKTGYSASITKSPEE